MSDYIRTKDRYTVSTDKSRLDIAMIHNFLTNEAYWSKGIPLAVVQKGIQNALCFGLYDGTRQVGFARVVSDLATFAYLADVFVIEAYRGQALGKWLVECVTSHPDLQGLRRFMLFTRDAHSLYEQYGFSRIESVEQMQRMMQIVDPDVYQR